MKYRVVDLEYIYVRAQLPDGKWDSLSIKELSDKQFLTWVIDRFGKEALLEVEPNLEEKSTLWSSQNKVNLLNKLTKKTGIPLAMLKPEARNQFDKGIKNEQD